MDPPKNDGNASFFQIYLIVYDSRISMRVKEYDSLSVIYELVEEIFKIPTVDQYLIVKGLDDGWYGEHSFSSIIKWKIKSGDTLVIYKAIKAGGFGSFSFANLFPNNEKTINFDPKAPVWKKVHPGLNLSGTCYNNVCEAFRSRVWVPKEFGMFQMRRESTEAKCVRCGQQLFNVINCGFYKCFFSIEGTTDSNVSLSVSHREAPDDKFLTFHDVTQGHTLQYEFLKITTTPKSESSCTLL